MSLKDARFCNNLKHTQLSLNRMAYVIYMLFGILCYGVTMNVVGIYRWFTQQLSLYMNVVAVLFTYVEVNYYEK